MGLSFIGDAIKGVVGVIDTLHTSDDERNKAALELSKLDLEYEKIEAGLATAQAKINEQEASHPSLFVAGWRPAAGWACVLGLFYQFVCHPFLLWGWAAFQAWGLVPLTATPPPPVEVEILLSLLFGMLGLGGYRTWERLKGVSQTKQLK